MERHILFGGSYHAWQLDYAFLFKFLIMFTIITNYSWYCFVTFTVLPLDSDNYLCKIPAFYVIFPKCQRVATSLCEGDHYLKSMQDLMFSSIHHFGELAAWWSGCASGGPRYLGSSLTEGS